MSKQIQQMFSNISPTYDRLNHLLSWGLDHQWRRKAISNISLHENDSIKVLDLCAGTCDFSLECIKTFVNAEVDALDFSEEMLAFGKEKIKKQKMNINTIQGDALCLPMEDGVYDVVLCGFGVRNLDDVILGLNEIQRVLKPGGQVIVLDFFKPTKKTTKLFYKTYGKHIIPFLGYLLSRDRHAYRYLRRSIHDFVTKEEFGELFERNGFEQIVMKDFVFRVSSMVSAIKRK